MLIFGGPKRVYTPAWITTLTGPSTSTDTR